MMSDSLSGRGRKTVQVDGNSFRHKLARTIRERRLAMNLRAESVAEAVSKELGRPVSVQAWYHWEKATHPFDIDVLPIIAKVLKLTVHELIPREE